MYSELLRKYGIDSQLDPEKIVDLLTGKRNKTQDILDNLDNEKRIEELEIELVQLDDAITYYLHNEKPEVTGISRISRPVVNVYVDDEYSNDVVEEVTKPKQEVTGPKQEKIPDEAPEELYNKAIGYYEKGEYKKSLDYAKKSANEGNGRAMILEARLLLGANPEIEDGPRIDCYGLGIDEEKASVLVKAGIKKLDDELRKQKRSLFKNFHDDSMTDYDVWKLVFSDEQVVNNTIFLADAYIHGIHLWKDERWIEPNDIGAARDLFHNRSYGTDYIDRINHPEKYICQNPDILCLIGDTFFFEKRTENDIHYLDEEGKEKIEIRRVKAPRRAMRWYEQAAFQGSLRGAEIASIHYETGKYIEKDYVRAAAYSLIAWELGGKHAHLGLERIQDKTKFDLSHRCDISKGILFRYGLSLNETNQNIIIALEDIKEQKETLQKTGNKEEKVRTPKIIAYLESLIRFLSSKPANDTVEETFANISKKKKKEEAAKQEDKAKQEENAAKQEEQKVAKEDTMTYECALRFLASEEEDYQEYGMEWLVKLADQGDMHSLAKLGDMYYMGNRVTKDIDKAFSYLKKAAEAGHIPSQFTLAFMYNKGEGTEIDSEEYAYWMKQAALGGEPTAMLNTGWNYINGYGLCRDPKKGIDWLEKSAENNEPRAMTALGECYYRGIGVSRDLYKAKDWLEKAIKQGDKKDAEPFLNEVKRELNINDALRRGF